MLELNLIKWEKIHITLKHRNDEQNHESYLKQASNTNGNHRIL